MDLHPIVGQMSPSPEQRPAVLARSRDIVVTAGAGTGKTRTLVARYLSLLAEGHDLRAVLAITFTRKAAREMRNRVRDQIRLYLDRPDLGRAERQLWQDRYSGLDAARIGTIHSFCAELLRAHPAEAGLDPRFEVLEDGRANILKGRAVDGALAWAADEPSVVELFALLGERTLRATLESLLAQWVDAEAVFDGLPVDLLAHWQGALRTVQERTLAALVRTPAWIDAGAALRDNAALLPDDRMEIQRQAALGALQGALAALQGADLDALAGLGAINLTGGSMKAWPGGKEQLAEVKEALRTLREAWRAAAPLLELALGDLDWEWARAIPALQALFARAVTHYDQLKEERRALDYDDLERGALLLLRDHAEVRARWQRDIQAILVDEFQDTNGRQRDLVALLDDGSKLFVVGDAKQSIYRFRGADVAVFRQERERVITAGGLHLPLETSYRAHEELVQALNDLLGPVLGEVDDPDRPWAEPFAPLRPYRRQAGPGFVVPHVELHLTAGPKSGGALHRAGAALSARLLQLREAGVQVAGADGPRPLVFDDIAILCRASTSFGAYEDALEQAGIPFLTVAGRGFYDRPEIRDLLNALQALSDPTDDLVLAGLLRSPAFALSDLSLYHLCRERDERGIRLWDLLQLDELGPALSESEGDRARRAAGVVERLHGRVGRASVADLLKAFVDETAYRAALISAGQARAARNVSKLLADANASGIVGVGEFLEYLKGLRDVGAREGEARAVAEGAVQVMTIHAAKGLEFPVVVIGDVSRGGGRGSGLLLDAEFGPLHKLQDDDREDAAPAAYQLGKLRAADQEAAESDRLLYVAATRAREKLILSGCISLKKGNVVGRAGGSLGRLAGPGCLGLYGLTIDHDEEGAEAIVLPLQVGSTPVACTIYEPNYEPLAAGLPHQLAAGPRPAASDEPAYPTPLPPPLLQPVEAGAEHADDRVSAQDRIPAQRVWQVVPAAERPRAPAWIVGSLVHEALAAWRFPDEESPSLPDQAYARWAEARARGYGLADNPRLADAVRRSAELLLRFQAHALYREMDTAGRRLHEVPYSLLIDGTVESGIIDALCQRQGVWTIVEFKTDEVRNQADLDQVLAREDYLAQVRRYAVAVERLLGQRPRSVLCLLNYAGAVHLVRV